jgi:hypothetical protein
MASKSNANSDIDFNSLNRLNKTSSLETSSDGHSECGSMLVSASEVHYVGSNHWAAILDSIADLRDYFDRDEQLRLAASPDQIQDDTRDAGNVKTQASRHSLLLYGGHCSASQAEILTALPPKAAVDRYISYYFNRQELVSCKYASLIKL